MSNLTLALRALRELGPRPLALYACYQAGLRSGWLKLRTRRFEWDERPLSAWLRPGVPADPSGYLAFRRRQMQHLAFLFDPYADLAPALKRAAAAGEPALLAEADGIIDGRYRLFGRDPDSLGFPPRWDTFVPPAAGARLALDRHWSAYREPFPADIKLLWELSRFGWAFPLARAYRLTGSERYYEAFWLLFEAWTEANQPNAGPHWISAQEVALRLMALLFAFHAFAPALLKSPTRTARLAQALAVHAARIPPTLTYARAQGNNHLLTEAVALYSLGLLFPELRGARRWRASGRRWLVAALEAQVFPDGGYVQHSANYHRLALQAGLWALGLARANDDPLPQGAVDALRRADECLRALVDPESGATPNFGPNDGAHILRISTCAHQDFRPVVQAAACLLRGEPALGNGPWDEACLWLGAPIAKRRPAVRPPGPPRRRDFPHAGLYLLRGRRAWAVLRCARFHSRPGHADQLHLDLWWRGHNVARDAGTYLYSAPPPWDNTLAAAAVHNTMLIDGREPMRRAGRFLWLDWDQGRFLGRWHAGRHLEALAASHDGYRLLGVIHRRTVVRAGDDLWLVVDDLLGEGQHRARLGWLLPDWPWTLEAGGLRLGGPPGTLSLRVEGQDLRLGVFEAGRLVAGEAQASASATLGWYCPTYAAKRPAPFLTAELQAELPQRFVTWWLFNGAGPESLELAWNPPQVGLPALSHVAFEGHNLDLSDAHPVDSSGLRRAG